MEQMTEGTIRHHKGQRIAVWNKWQRGRSDITKAREELYGTNDRGVNQTSQRPENSCMEQMTEGTIRHHKGQRIAVWNK